MATSTSSTPTSSSLATTDYVSRLSYLRQLVRQSVDEVTSPVLKSIFPTALGRAPFLAPAAWWYPLSQQQQLLHPHSGRHFMCSVYSVYETQRSVAVAYNSELRAPALCICNQSYRKASFYVYHTASTFIYLIRTLRFDSN